MRVSTSKMKVNGVPDGAEIGLPGDDCRVCGSRTSIFWEMDGVPVHCNVLYARREDALSVSRGRISLAACESCGFVQNDVFDPALVAYDGTYENALHFSSHFQAYAHDLAALLVRKYSLQGKRIVEIACGDGSFLKLLCTLGGNDGIGFDPSIDDSLPSPALSSGSVQLIAEYYDARHAGAAADFVCCRHALEHIADPVAFVRMVRDNLEGSRDAVVFFEVPDVMYTVRDMGVWDIIYEHCCYFSSASLERCFLEAGFRILDSRSVYDGQFLCIEASIADGITGRERGRGRNGDGGVRALCDSFALRCRAKIADWSERMVEWTRDGRKVVVWGAGSKGVTFLNTLGGVGAIECIVDVNPRKHGNFVAGAGQEIISPDELAKQGADCIVVMNGVYVKEIERAVSSMGMKAEIMVA